MIKWLVSIFKKEQEAPIMQETVMQQTVHGHTEEHSHGHSHEHAKANSCAPTGSLDGLNLPKKEIQGTFTITPSTVERVKTLLTKDGRSNAFLRFSVVSGGCSGYSYDFKIDDTLNTEDIAVEMDGVKVVTDQQSIQLINGSELDYVDDASGSKFDVKNPNASHGCGCGSSFGM